MPIIHWFASRFTEARRFLAALPPYVPHIMRSQHKRMSRLRRNLNNAWRRRRAWA